MQIFLILVFSRLIYSILKVNESQYILLLGKHPNILRVFHLIICLLFIDPTAVISGQNLCSEEHKMADLASCDDKEGCEGREQQSSKGGDIAVLCAVSRSCPTLCDPMNCSQPGSSVHGNSPGTNTGVGWIVLFLRIFPNQGSSPGLSH